MEEKKNNRRHLVGVVVSDKMTNTVVVNIESIKVHPKYHKRYKVTSKYVAHNEGNEFHVGDRVVIEESRPLSKTKRWKVISKA